jgi:hypothetical protein
MAAQTVILSPVLCFLADVSEMVHYEQKHTSE